MAFKGLTLTSLYANPDELQAAWQETPWPKLQSWRMISNFDGQYLWQVKPPGRWAALLRFDEYLVANTDQVPLDVDYEKVYTMLREHRAVLLCRLSSDPLLIGVAVKSAAGVFTPLMPGYFAGTTVDVRTLDAQGIEHLSEQAHDWPQGLQRPAVIGLQAAKSLNHPDHREDLLRRYPEGVWLATASSSGGLTVYEVLS